MRTRRPRLPLLIRPVAVTFAPVLTAGGRESDTRRAGARTCAAGESAGKRTAAVESTAASDQAHDVGACNPR
jgi:hypothetical protein